VHTPSLCIGALSEDADARVLAGAGVHVCVLTSSEGADHGKAHLFSGMMMHLKKSDAYFSFGKHQHMQQEQRARVGRGCSEEAMVMVPGERIVVSGVDGYVLGELVRYVYSGAIHVSGETVEGVRRAAVGLGMEGVVRLCDMYVARHCCGGPVG